MKDLLDALVAFAAEYDVKVDDPVVLGDTSNIVVHLKPAPIVARVPFITALGRDQPGVSLARELALAAHLDAVGIPTILPSSVLPAGPHRLENGQASDPNVQTWVSFMEYVRLEPVADDDAAQVGERLADLLEAAASLSDPDGVFGRSLAEETAIGLDRLAGRIPDDDIAALRRSAERTLVARADSAQPLHGDPHRRNIGRRADGELVWFDFDDGVMDAPQVDIATLTRNWPEAGRVTCARRGIDPDGPELARYIAQREMWGGMWTQYFATEVGGRWVAEAAEVLASAREAMGDEP